MITPALGGGKTACLAEAFGDLDKMKTAQWNMLRWPIRWQLLLLVVITILPAIGISYYQAATTRRNDIANAVMEAHATVQTIVTAQEQSVESIRQLFLTLSRLPQVQALDVKECNKLFKDMLDDSSLKSSVGGGKSALNITLGLADSNGIVIASGIAFTPGSVQIADRKYYRDALRSREFSMGEYVTSRTTGKPTIHCALPVFDVADTNSIKGVFYAGINLYWFDELFKELNLPEKSTLTFCDHQGNILRDLPLSESVSSRKQAGPELVKPEIWSRMKDNMEPEGNFSADGPDGLRRLYAFKRLSIRGRDNKPYLYILTGIPELKALSNANAVFRDSLFLLGATTLASTLIAWMFGNFIISRRLNKLAHAARCVADGDFHTKTGIDYQSGELGALARSFDEMAVALAQKEKERVEAEKALHTSEVQLRHAQKMEAIGRLAGGIAHDFNNILTGIIGYSSMLLEDDSIDSAHKADLEEIRKAGGRAADLTRQLLAFSRKQIVSPITVDLNRLVGESHKMLARLIGEDVKLVFYPADTLASVMIDPGQLEQILANLAVNARDAMPKGGNIVIRTMELEWDEHSAKLEQGVRPGRWVCLSVSDTGCGMDENVLAHLFEPFFTTKDQGKGTGLGLATIYGIVEQNRGFITVQSKPGKGSEFRVYLPPVTEGLTSESRDAASGSAKSPGGHETLLLVEDEDSVRSLAAKMLRNHGYSVIAASGGAEALSYCREGNAKVDLLVSDVIMPDMNGRELYEQLRTIKPGLKVLFMSGYNEDVIDRQGVLMDGVFFINKPFTSETIARKVREACDAL